MMSKNQKKVSLSKAWQKIKNNLVLRAFSWERGWSVTQDSLHPSDALTTNATGGLGRASSFFGSFCGGVELAT